MKNLKQVKIIFLDIDGTIFYNPTKEILPSTKEALVKLKENGFILFINTSRAYNEMCKLPKEIFELTDGVATCAGSYVLYNGEVINHSVISNSAIKPIIDWLDHNDLTYRYVLKNQECYLNRDEPSKSAIFKMLYDYIPPVKKYENEDITHLLFYTHNHEEFIEVSKINNDLECVEIKGGGEIQAKGISKSSVIESVSSKFNLTINETCAIGDGQNDIPMIEKAYVGIAMGNSDDIVKQSADYVADDIKNDGFYKIVKEMGWI